MHTRPNRSTRATRLPARIRTAPQDLRIEGRTVRRRRPVVVDQVEAGPVGPHHGNTLQPRETLDVTGCPAARSST